jgi:hypothetical protein
MAMFWRAGSLTVLASAITTVLVVGLLAVPPSSQQSSIQENGVTIAGLGFKDIRGSEVTECVDCGLEMLMLTAQVRNDLERTESFVAYLELRDAEGYAVFNGLGIGTLDANQTSEIALSWAPKESGQYELRAFAMDNTEDKDWMSRAQSTTITITGVPLK